MDESIQWEERRGENPRRPQDGREESERDLARIVHSAAFRRLQGKTQILGIGESDFHRTRLTHSMEVAQIGRGIVYALERGKIIKDDLPNLDRIVAICLAHDLGHPPYGHGGEIALNYVMRDHGGFEGNAQTLRMLSKLEAHTESHGLNLTRRTLLGILKYPVAYSSVRKLKLPEITENTKTQAKPWKPPKCYHDCDQDIIDWILEPLSDADRTKFTKHTSPTDDVHGKALEKSLDTSIMELADDIAYGVHDLEDAIRLELIRNDHWISIETEMDTSWMKEFDLTNVRADLFSSESSRRKRAIGGLVNSFIGSMTLGTTGLTSPIVGRRVVLKGAAKKSLDALKKLVAKEIIHSPEVQTLEYRGQQIVMKLFEAFNSDPTRLLKAKFANRWNETSNDSEKVRVVCDFIAGMTDEYATRMYERLFIPRQGTVFWRL